MKVTTTPIEVWSTEFDDQGGGLARALRAISEFGVNLEYVVAQRNRDRPGKGILYVASADRQVYLDRVTDVGLQRVSPHSLLRIEGHDEPGAAAKVARAIDEAGVAVASFSGTAEGQRFICYAEFESTEDRAKAHTALKALNSHPTWAFWSRDTAVT